MDVMILLAVAVSGAAGLNPLVTLAAALALTMMSAKRKFKIARTYPDVGSGRILATALFLSLANNTAFTVLSYLLGRAVALLV
jgi:hypothetical protein